jgi:serine/threonine protein kinase
MDAAPSSACPHCFGDLSATTCPRCGWGSGTENPPPALTLGTLLDDRYRIGRVLGHGGFGITYLAWDENLHLRLAIKEYLPRDCATRAPDGVSLAIYSGQAGEQFAYGLDRFLEEARALARFDQHPGIVTVKSFFRAHGTGYCVMDYVEGITLKQHLERQSGGRIPVEQAWRLLAPVMDALRAVHKEGLLHRDLAPDNIYITREGRVKLLDFGAARFAAGEHSRSLSIILRPGYAPEEQYRTRGKQGPWTDVYGLAATLYRAITGTAPPDALDRLDEDDLVAPSRLGIGITAVREAVLLKALSVRATTRYPSMQGLQEAWSAVESAKKMPPASSSPPSASPKSPPASAKPVPESEDLWSTSPGRWGVGGLLAFVLIGVLGLVGLRQSGWTYYTPVPETSTVHSPSSPTMPRQMSDRYRPLGPNGAIIEDTTTGLQWMRCSQGQHWNGVTCEGEASTLTWEDAMRQPRGVSLAGQTDWRVPTKDELVTLVYCSTGQPKTWNDTGSVCEGDYQRTAIDQFAFPKTPDSRFWSSSPYANYPSIAWYVSFSYGNVLNLNKSYQIYVRLVRDGQ